MRFRLWFALVLSTLFLSGCWGRTYAPDNEFLEYSFDFYDVEWDKRYNQFRVGTLHIANPLDRIAYYYKQIGFDSQENSAFAICIKSGDESILASGSWYSDNEIEDGGGPYIPDYRIDLPPFETTEFPVILDLRYAAGSFVKQAAVGHLQASVYLADFLADPNGVSCPSITSESSRPLGHFRLIVKR